MNLPSVTSQHSPFSFQVDNFPPTSSSSLPSSGVSYSSSFSSPTFSSPTFSSPTSFYPSSFQQPLSNEQLANKAYDLLEICFFQDPRFFHKECVEKTLNCYVPTGPGSWFQDLYVRDRIAFFLRQNFKMENIEDALNLYNNPKVAMSNPLYFMKSENKNRVKTQSMNNFGIMPRTELINQRQKFCMLWRDMLKHMCRNYLNVSGRTIEGHITFAWDTRKIGTPPYNKNEQQVYSGSLPLQYVQEQPEYTENDSLGWTRSSTPIIEIKRSEIRSAIVGVSIPESIAQIFAKENNPDMNYLILLMGGGSVQTKKNLMKTIPDILFMFSQLEHFLLLRSKSDDEVWKNWFYECVWLSVSRTHSEHTEWLKSISLSSGSINIPYHSLIGDNNNIIQSKMLPIQNILFSAFPNTWTFYDGYEFTLLRIPENQSLSFNRNGIGLWHEMSILSWFTLKNKDPHKARKYLAEQNQNLRYVVLATTTPYDIGIEQANIRHLCGFLIAEVDSSKKLWIKQAVAINFEGAFSYALKKIMYAYLLYYVATVDQIDKIAQRGDPNILLRDGFQADKDIYGVKQEETNSTNEKPYWQQGINLASAAGQAFKKGVIEARNSYYFANKYFENSNLREYLRSILISRVYGSLWKVQRNISSKFASNELSSSSLSSCNETTLSTLFSRQNIEIALQNAKEEKRGDFK